MLRWTFGFFEHRKKGAKADTHILHNWYGYDPDFAQKKNRKILEQKVCQYFQKRKKGASVEDEILHGDKWGTVL